MESIGLLYLTLSSLSVKWHHRQLQGPLYDIGFLNKSSITSDQLKVQKESCLIYWTWFTSLRCTGVMRRYEWKLWVMIIMISVVGGQLYSYDNNIILLFVTNYLNDHDQCCGWPIIRDLCALGRLLPASCSSCQDLPSISMHILLLCHNHYHHHPPPHHHHH